MAEIEYIEIDPVSRKILSPDGMLLGVLEDKDVERKYFKCPKIVGDNIDLSEHQIYIKFIQALNKEGTKFEIKDPGRYHCEDVSDEGDYITFSWKLGPEVFEEDGYVAFSVMALDGEETRWNTTPSVGIVLITIPGGVELGYSTNTFDATAKGDNIESGFSAYVKGKKVDGEIELQSSLLNLVTTNSITSNEGSVTFGEATDSPISMPSRICISFKPVMNGKELVNSGTKVIASARASKFGNAKPEDVTEGVTFTSENGLNLTGTKKATGLQRKSGTVELTEDAAEIVIDTGLTNVETIVVKTASQGVSMTYIWMLSETLNLTIYRTQYLSSVSTSAYATLEGGVATCKQYSDSYPLKAGTYYWEAYGE